MCEKNLYGLQNNMYESKMIDLYEVKGMVHVKENKKTIFDTLSEMSAEEQRNMSISSGETEEITPKEEKERMEALHELENEKTDFTMEDFQKLIHSIKTHTFNKNYKNVIHLKKNYTNE